MKPHKKLVNQPLKFALAEFRFSPITQIADFIPSLQERLRRKYPNLKSGKEQVIRFHSGGLDVSTIEGWAFISANKKEAVGINQERVIYVTSDYDRFPKFSDACEEILRLLIEIAEPGLLSRIGLRYSDLVLIGQDHDVSQLVDPHLGHFDWIGSLGTAQRKATESFVQTGVGVLHMRSLYGINDLICLPDALQLPVALGGPEDKSERVILDFDHYWDAEEEPISFEIDSILGTLQSLHQVSIDAFWKITTKYAKDELWA